MSFKDLPTEAILNSLPDGVYITDLERRVLFWNDSAERITGWPRDRVVGRCCHEQILEHVDKDGRALCGEEHCPLHRSIITGRATNLPITVYAGMPDGGRTPVSVSTSPLRDSEGRIVGGIEVFRDESNQIGEMRRAKAIQATAIQANHAPDSRVRIRTLYAPLEIIGGDFYAIEDLDEDHVVLFIADVMGHGVASALYTMYFRLLWMENSGLIGEPARFLAIFNERIHPLLSEIHYFATAAIILLNKKTGELVCSGAGHPSPLILRGDGGFDMIDCTGMPLGMMQGTLYEETRVRLHPGDSLFLYTDGAIEGRDKEGNDLGELGLARIIHGIVASGRELTPKSIETAALQASNEVRPADDLTMVWMDFLHDGRDVAGPSSATPEAPSNRPH